MAKRRTARQIAASRRNLAKARAARRSRGRRIAHGAVTVAAIASIGAVQGYRINSMYKSKNRAYGTTTRNIRHNKAAERHLRKIGHSGKYFNTYTDQRRVKYDYKTKSYRGKGYMPSSPQLSLMARKPKYTHKQFISGSGKSYRL